MEGVWSLGAHSLVDTNVLKLCAKFEDFCKYKSACTKILKFADLLNNGSSHRALERVLTSNTLKNYDSYVNTELLQQTARSKAFALAMLTRSFDSNLTAVSSAILLFLHTKFP